MQMLLFLFYFVGFCMAKIFPVKWLYCFAESLASLYYKFAEKDKEVIGENLKIVLGKDVSQDILDEKILNIFKNFARYLTDFFKVTSYSREQILANVDFRNKKYLDDALLKNKGIIMLTAHLGNWELGGAVIAALGYPISAIILEHKNVWINKLFRRQRTENDVKCIPLGMQLKQCFRVLKNNEVLAIAGDKDYSGTGKETIFFGHKAKVPQGAALLSAKTGAPIICCMLIRKEDNSFTMYNEKPIWPENSGDIDRDSNESMNRYIEIFENYISEYPDQWYAFDSIWKKT
jgi:lauroyl/myristoyl acyltransferase